MTYSEAIEKVMIDNDGYAPLKLIYQNIEKYRKKTGLTPDKSIQERMQRDNKFTRIGSGVYALTSFVENVEKEDLGRFVYNDDKEIKFKSKKPTEKIIKSKARIGQGQFRKNLLREFNKTCPITRIDDQKLLIAAHIKPWSHSDDEEKLNSKNGILLSPLFDKLFDKDVGLISFTCDKRILLSKKLKKNADRIGIKHGQFIPNLKTQGRGDFLLYHEEFIFEQNQ